ncbi:MAG TPA: Gfo/Idh/MocA family oxidoreductase [Kofleriaceae bacterium]|nr:Gfo/Idh/MocA family oxidoreductase [Kofleriaceae bacterium]
MAGTMIHEPAGTRDLEAVRAPGKPRLGFAGVGWIGRHRLEAVVEAGCAEVVVIADPVAEHARAAAEAVPQARVTDDLADLARADIDGVVIATPSALHAEQAMAVLETGRAVFCQKPLGRTAAEVRAVVDAARAANALLGVDLCYRKTAAMQRVRRLVTDGELGRVYAAHLMFHNAYGPDKPWFHDRRLSGGGCLIDLGVHLADLALWTLGRPVITRVSGRLFREGHRIDRGDPAVEDYAIVRLDLDTGAVVDLACSWNLPAGRDAVIDARFFGTDGGAAMRNVGGSFYDFTAEHWRGTATETLCAPPDDWGGRTIIDWAERLGRGERFDPDIDALIDVAEVLDRAYGR